MEELDSLFQIKPVCYWSFETHHLTDCVLRAWRVLLDFPRVQLTIHETPSPVRALLLCSRTLYSRIFSVHRAIKKSFRFHEERGLQEEFSHRVRENET